MIHHLLGLFSDWEIQVPVVLTTLIGVLALSRRASGTSLGDAVLRTLDALGFAAVFFVGNLMAGVLLLLAVRLIGINESLYVVSDASLLALSLLQGLLFASWRSGPPRAASGANRRTQVRIW